MRPRVSNHGRARRAARAASFETAARPDKAQERGLLRMRVWRPTSQITVQSY